MKRTRAKEGKGRRERGTEKGESGTNRKVINFVTPILFARRRFQPRTFVIVRPQNYSNGRGERIHSGMQKSLAAKLKVDPRWI